MDISLTSKNKNKKSRSERSGFFRFTIPIQWVLALIFLVMVTVVAVVILIISAMNVGQPSANYIKVELIRGLIFSSTFGLFAAFYNWFSKMFGMMYNKWLAGAHFWFFLIGVNVALFPANYMNITFKLGRWIGREKDLEILNQIRDFGGWTVLAGFVIFFVMLIEALLITRRRIDLDVDVSKFD